MKRNSKLVLVGGILVSIFTVIIISVTLPSFVANGKDSDFVIKDGVLIAYKGNDEEVTIPTTVTSIGGSAFTGNEEIKSVIMTDSVTNIDGMAFWNCSNLVDIQIPCTVKSIGSGAFQLTPWLGEQQKKNPLVIVNNILIDASTCKGSVVIGSDVKDICAQAFAFNSNLTKVTISNSTTSISQEAFVSCQNLKTVIMGDGVKYMGKNVFQRCKSLTYVKLSKSLTLIPEGTFWQCSKLSNITIPDSVKKVDTAFDSCKKLKSVTFSSKVTSIDKEAFTYSNTPTIYGIKNSYAEKYAKNNKLTFKILGMSKKNIDLKVGETTSLKLNSTAICTWKSTNKSFAKVNSNGKVTAIKKGNVLIKATIYGKTYSCKVTIK
ncbi:leucine-rich repeat domain-containing protein [Anaerosporobacter sp.]